MKKTFKKNNYSLIKSAISRELAIFLYNYFIVKRQVAVVAKKERFVSPYENWRIGRFGDPQVQNNPKTFCIYGTPTFDTLLLLVQPILEKETGLKLLPTYSYARLYTKWDVLKRHKDRPECAFSTTLNLGGDGWPIFLEPKKNIGRPGENGATMETTNKGVKINLTPGDLLVYRGDILEHWREPFNGNECGQVFLHFVEATALNKKLLYDGRQCLGVWERPGDIPFTEGL